jgi:hypothetical protein
MEKLGLRDKTINTIQNYLSKGGRFITAEDVKKFTVFFPMSMNELLPTFALAKMQQRIMKQHLYQSILQNL